MWNQSLPKKDCVRGSVFLWYWQGPFVQFCVVISGIFYIWRRFCYVYLDAHVDRNHLWFIFVSLCPEWGWIHCEDSHLNATSCMFHHSTGLCDHMILVFVIGECLHRPPEPISNTTLPKWGAKKWKQRRRSKGSDERFVVWVGGKVVRAGG